MRILAIDPGPTPGLAAYDTNTENMLAWIAPDWFSGCASIAPRIPNPVWDVIVCESFSIGGQRAKSSNETIEMIGIARYYALCHGLPFVEQSPADAAGFGTTGKLKKMGWWIPGKADHARSAATHLLLYLSREHLIDVARLLS